MFGAAIITDWLPKPQAELENDHFFAWFPSTKFSDPRRVWATLLLHSPSWPVSSGTSGAFLSLGPEGAQSVYWRLRLFRSSPELGFSPQEAASALGLGGRIQRIPWGSLGPQPQSSRCVRRADTQWECPLSHRHDCVTSVYPAGLHSWSDFCE